MIQEVVAHLVDNRGIDRKERRHPRMLHPCGSEFFTYSVPMIEFRRAL